MGWEEGQWHHNNVNITLIVFTKCQISFCHFIYINPQFILRATPTLSVLLSPHFTDKKTNKANKKGPRAGRRQRRV